MSPERNMLMSTHDLLAAWELVLSAAESLNGGWLVRITGSDGQDDLANVHTGDETVWLAESTTHSGLQSIGTSARQHLVDAHDVVWVGADTHVETFLSCNLDHVPEPSVSLSILFFRVPPSFSSLCDVLVRANTGGLEGLGAQLLILVGDEVDAGWELVDVRTLTAEIEDTDLWAVTVVSTSRVTVQISVQYSLWHTTVEARLGVRLVLAVAVATSWTAGHCCGVSMGCRWVSKGELAT